jgi:hemagglutinin
MNKKFLLVAGVLTIVSGNVMGAVTTDDQGTISYSNRYSSFPTTLKDGANFNQRHIEFSTMDTTKSSEEFKVSEFTSESMQIEDNRNNDRNYVYIDSNGLTASYADRTGPNNFQTRENLELTLHKVSMNNNRVEKIAKGIESEDAVNLSQLQEVENKIKDVASGSNITVKKELDFFGRETNTSVVNLNEDLVDMNSIKFGTEDDNAKSEINQTSVSFYNDKQNEGSALTSHSLEMNTKNGSSSLDGTSLTISNGIDGNIATMGANGFATETKDGKHLEFSSDNVTVAGQQIHDVAKGIDDTDAVNVKQLKDYVAANDKDTITTVKAGNNIEVTANGHDYTVSLKKDVVDKIDNATAGVKANADAIKSNADAVKSNTDAIKANTADIAVNKAQIVT